MAVQKSGTVQGFKMDRGMVALIVGALLVVAAGVLHLLGLPGDPAVMIGGLGALMIFLQL